MKCEICARLYDSEVRRPKVLRCGHTYCLPCLQSMLVRRCPDCRLAFQSPQNLPDHIKYLALADKRVQTVLDRDPETVLTRLGDAEDVCTLRLETIKTLLQNKNQRRVLQTSRQLTVHARKQLAGARADLEAAANKSPEELEDALEVAAQALATHKAVPTVPELPEMPEGAEITVTMDLDTGMKLVGRGSRYAVHQAMMAVHVLLDGKLEAKDLTKSTSIPLPVSGVDQVERPCPDVANSYESFQPLWKEQNEEATDFYHSSEDLTIDESKLDAISPISETSNDLSPQKPTVTDSPKIGNQNECPVTVCKNLFPIDQSLENPEQHGNCTDFETIWLDSQTVRMDYVGKLASLPVGVVFDVPVVQVNEEVPNNEATQETPLKISSNPKKVTKQRRSNPEQWKANVARRLLAAGKEHVTHRGVHRRGRAMKEGCDRLVCRMNCHRKVTETDRQSMFDQFWKIETQKEKWDFIARHLEVTQAISSIRKTRRKYFFRVRSVKIYVCKTMFLDTLDVCDSLIETTISKMRSDAAISPDKRTGGHNHKESARMKTVKDSVKEHIGTIPRLLSHYSRETSNKEYVVGDFQSCVDMYDAYKTWMATNHPDKPVATYRKYVNVFNTEFKISFYTSKKDQCDMCVTWNNRPEGKRHDLQDEYKLHLSNKDIVTAMKNSDTAAARIKENKKHLVVAHFDFENNLICPKFETSTIYYKRKLCVSNFTVVDVGRFEDCCYVYDESVAHEGSNEVASFLLNFISRKYNAGCKEFSFFCGSCGEQSRNRNIIAMIVYAAAKFNASITLKYLEKGHTHNACDSLHSLINRKAKRRTMFCPDQWYDLIENCKWSKAHPVVLERVDQNMIFNWNILTEKLNLDTDVNGNSVPWRSLCLIETSSLTPHQFKFKTSFEEEARTVCTEGVGTPVNFSTYQLQSAYQGALPISKAKHKDLLFYCKENHVPQQYHEFYNSLSFADTVLETPEDVVQEPMLVGRPRKRKTAYRVPSEKSKGTLVPRRETSSKRRRVVVEESDEEYVYESSE